MSILKFKSISATIVAAILMGALGFFVREAGMEAGILTFFRFLIGFLLMSVFILFRTFVKKKKLIFSAISMLSGASISLCILFYFMAIQQINIGLAAFTMYLGPIFAIIGEALISRKMLSKRQFLIISLAFLGFFLISSLWSVSDIGMSNGLIFALLSGLFYGGYILSNRYIREDVDLSTRIFWQFLAAVVVIGLTCLVAGSSLQGFEEGWPYALTIGVVHGFIVLMLTGFAIKHLSSVEYGSMSYIEPLVALIIGVFLYKEGISPFQILGIVLIVLATALQCKTISNNK